MVGSRVYVGGLPYGTTERDLERFFRGYGRMRDVLIKNGYGFVEFDDYRDADDAVYELNGKKLLGERVTVERARGTPRGRDQWSTSSSSSSRNNDHRSHERYGPPTRTNYRLVVENLSSRISWQDLKDYMRQAGEVTYADAHKQHRNEGVVEFASYSDMKTAIEKLDDTELNGRRIRLVEDKKTKSRRSTSYSSRSRSRSRSPRRSRSRSRSRRSSHSKSKSRSRSGSAKADREKSKSRSRSRSNSRKKSNDRSRSNSRKKSVERSRSRSHSPTPDKRSKSREESKDRSRSRSRSASKGRSKSRSRSPSAN
ncbi:serine-arginine protein 55 isoform X4 [Leptinotarsa decemlineata]|uniref:serine-arginine protein 55 isoform X4 n=1 Tax=Leptinotarsa decemlineata TaxID=7539 RepID=UPI000C254C0F|nr:serine-arginine protein 55 [Leptinotarsa decemlineata]